jgi:1,3-beta-glucan synthase
MNRIVLGRLASGGASGIGLGAHAMSQPAREFVVKIIELELWSSDSLCHIIFAILTPLLLIPYVDRMHATSEFWYYPRY